MPDPLPEQPSETVAVTVFALDDHSEGVKAPVETAIPDDHSTFKLSASRENWPVGEGDVVECRTEILLDDGTWQLLVGFTATGGDALDPDGNPTTESWAATALPGGKTGRKIRTTMTVLKPSLRTQIAVETK